MKINDDETMVSFDVVSLFTAIPFQKTCHYIRTKLEQDDTLTLRTNLTIDDIISLLDFTLSNNYFIYNDVTYKQGKELFATELFARIVHQPINTSKRVKYLQECS